MPFPPSLVLIYPLSYLKASARSITNSIQVTKRKWIIDASNDFHSSGRLRLRCHAIRNGTQFDAPLRADQRAVRGVVV